MKRVLPNFSKKNLIKGFTLIELLVVIAVLGVLAAIVLLAVNPGEQLARGRDTNRVSSITQLGRSLQAYYTASNGNYPTASATWMNAMTGSQDLKTIPTNPNYSTQTGFACTDFNQNGWCYKANLVGSNTEAIVFARVESTQNDNKCNTAATEKAWWVFSTADGRGGVVCTADATNTLNVQSYSGTTATSYRD
jgi:prepilin-type N-terminal cleavage/methylation domain-containing protein